MSDDAWISVGDRLPEVYEYRHHDRDRWRTRSDPVLAYRNDGSLVVATYFGAVGKREPWWSGDGFFDMGKKQPPVVTHWQPLPNPPRA